MSVHTRPEFCPPEKFTVEVFSELLPETVQQRWQAVNVILRLSMLSGLQMQLDATLNLMCDFAAEMVPHQHLLLYFWNEEQNEPQMRVQRGLDDPQPELIAGGSLLNFWATKFGRPLLIPQGHNEQADAALNAAQSVSAIVVPLFVNNRVMGSLQLFSREQNRFSPQDAQLLWMLSLVAESLLTREYANDGLIKFAFTDYLTGLKTRGYFEQQLDLEVKRCDRKKTPLSLLMVDIDFFKQINDRLGHHAGDEILRDIGAILMKDMREIDTVARYGGEEFVIVLPETNHAGAYHVAQRLRKRVEAARFFVGSPPAAERLTISIGISVFDTDAHTRRELVEFADAALYAAKHTGRNRVVLYSEVLEPRREVS